MVSWCSVSTRITLKSTNSTKKSVRKELKFAIEHQVANFVTQKNGEIIYQEKQSNDLVSITKELKETKRIEGESGVTRKKKDH